jgi:hypothetical protein
MRGCDSTVRQWDSLVELRAIQFMHYTLVGPAWAALGLTTTHDNRELIQDF